MINQQHLMDDDDVISLLDRDLLILISNKTFKVEELMLILSNSVTNTDKTKMKKWISDGVPCEVLSPSESWKKGKIKICLSFIPDEPVSPLDDIRQTINQ